MDYAKAKPVKGSEVDLTTWSWGLDIERLVSKHVSDVVREALDSSPPRLIFNAVYDAPDPLEMTIELPFGPAEGEDAEWTISLRDALADSVRGMRGGANMDGVIDPAQSDCLATIPKALRELADWLEAQCAPAPAQGIEARSGETVKQARSGTDESPVA